MVERRIERFGLRLRVDKDFELCDPEDDPRYGEYVALYHKKMKRRGVTRDAARVGVRTNFTVIGALMVVRGEADAMITGPNGRYRSHLRAILDVIGLREDVSGAYAMQVLIMNGGAYFIIYTNINENPDVDQIAEMTVLAAEEVRRFGVEPKAALLSHSNFGTSNVATAVKMRAAVDLIRKRAPGLIVDGEMHADSALLPALRRRLMPDSPLVGPANLLVMPGIDAGNIAYNVAKALGQGLSVGPVLIGAARPAHIVTPSVTVRGIVNMTALAVVDAQDHAEIAGGADTDTTDKAAE